MLWIAGGGVILSLLGLAGWIAVHLRDIAPPDTSDLAIETVKITDVNNACVRFRRAGDLSAWPRDASRADAILAGGQWDEAFVADLLSRNAQAFAELERGLAGPIYEAAAIPWFGPQTSSWQWGRLCKLMTLRVRYERRTDQTERAWKTCLDVLRVAALTTAHPAGELDWRMSVNLLEGGLKEVRGLLNEAYPGEVQLLRLSDELNRLGSFEFGWTRVIKTEFDRVNKEIGRSAYLLSFEQGLESYWFRPNRKRRTFAVFCRTMIENASRPYAAMRLPRARRMRDLPWLHPHGAAKTVLPAPDYLNACLAQKCEIQSHLDGLRLVVACRLHEVRAGQLPPTLDFLVPELLRQVPRDPFDGKPFRYAREHGVVYSVGKDLRDSWHPGTRTPDALSFSRRPAELDDLVYSLGRPE